MSWERFEKDYPKGMTTNFGYLTADQLRANPEIGVVTTLNEHVVRNMIFHEDLLIYGKDNEFAVSPVYDLENDSIKYTSDIHPLNMFAVAMIRDYLNYNYLS